MTKKVKMGRPRLDENEKGRIYTFFVPKELADGTETVLEYTGGTISEYLRSALEAANDRILDNYKGKAVQQSTLKTYTGGKVEP